MAEFQAAAKQVAAPQAEQPEGSLRQSEAPAAAGGRRSLKQAAGATNKSQAVMAARLQAVAQQAQPNGN